jgi:hypothetical protein
MRPAILLPLLVLAAAGRSAAFDLTGTWEGSATCTSFFAGEKIKFTDAPTIQITQVGDAIGLRADYGGGDVDLYTGIAHPDAKKPDEKGELALIACGTDSIAGNPGTFDEVGRFTAATKLGKVKATVKGVSFFSDPGAVTPEAGTCKWKLTRIDATDAAIATECPVTTSLRPLHAGEAPSRHRRGR